MGAAIAGCGAELTPQQIKTIPGVPSRHPKVDLVVIRENMEGEYAGVENEIVPGVVQSLKLATRANTERIARFAFDWAEKHGRKKVTIVHKANIMKLSDGLFLSICEDVARDYPKVAHEAMIVDNCSMQLVSNPAQFDVMVMPNLYGTICAHIGAGVSGGLGVTPAWNVSATKGDRDAAGPAIFETLSGNPPSIAGANIANPTALMRSSIAMLDYLHMSTHAQRLRAALYSVLQRGENRTFDLGGTASTSEFTAAVIKALK